MSDPVRNVELLRSLGRLARGLSALFWGLPVALVVCFQAGQTDWLRPLGVVPPLATTGWLLFGLSQMQSFQKQERIWRDALDRAKLIALVNLGLSPFLFWSSSAPAEPFFEAAIAVLSASALLFLINLNLVLQRLSAMLPDETLRHETRRFTTLNRALLSWTLMLVVARFVFTRFELLPATLETVVALVERFSPGPFILFVLLPLAMTMALIWKIKETILESVFGAE